jgi:hypothetical protein
MMQQDEVMDTEPDWLEQNNADRERYFKKMEVFHHAAIVRRNKEPLKIAAIESYPRCPYCHALASDKRSLDDHLFGGCDGEPAIKRRGGIIRMRQKPNQTDSIDKTKEEK